MSGRVLLIDDEEDIRLSMEQSLDLAGFEVESFAEAQSALDLINFGFRGIVVTDIRMPGMDGLTFMNRVAEIDAEIPVVLVTGHGDVQLAVRAMHDGAHDFLEKPFQAQQLTDIATRAMDFRRIILENRVLRAAAGQVDDLELRLVGRSNAMIDLRRRMRTIGPTEADVLIIGETGVGKEVVARALHDLSPRATRPFISIDCAALPASLIESELFGHDPGAFAGAMRERYGKFEHAQGGTILLDEIGSMPIDIQGKFLRVVENRVITRLGSHDERPLDVRFIATSRSPLEEEVAAGRFRADLLYRLNVVTLTIPPLSDRREDIPLLFSKLVQEAASRYRCDPPVISPRLINQVNAAQWPGNVRELRNAADRYALGVALQPVTDLGEEPMRLANQVAEFERNVLIGALLSHGGKLKPVYESLGLSRKSLYEKMQKYGIDKKQLGLEAEGQDD
ncbi:sigma-54-dependent transcriptional regulator [Paracoccus saliphilus]|uniref:Nif-specific regulatory protein n=1 Tax=Paracoccus saliphilus TaxID=405559 RepID=A0AA45W8C2_9RHOB|nr:sigma-54 dependent transcriptional regulator [Paracoccus saliphilus]WCR02625.1 sigma-54-dependent Fis family transcriptional regulator [Paracoccus saliphilus]SIT15594.1 two-component system, NtrC family, C4-dicarboxylate transport response regulator DctD [Paracoccus saliphilus]